MGQIGCIASHDIIKACIKRQSKLTSNTDFSLKCRLHRESLREFGVRRTLMDPQVINRNNCVPNTSRTADPHMNFQIGTHQYRALVYKTLNPERYFYNFLCNLIFCIHLLGRQLRYGEVNNENIQQLTNLIAYRTLNLRITVSTDPSVILRIKRAVSSVSSACMPRNWTVQNTFDCNVTGSNIPFYTITSTSGYFV